MRRRDDALELYRAAEVHGFEEARAQHIVDLEPRANDLVRQVAVGQMPPIRAIAASHCWRRRLAGGVVTSVHDLKMRVSSNRVSSIHLVVAPIHSLDQNDLRVLDSK